MQLVTAAFPVNVLSHGVLMQSTEDWEAVVSITSAELPSSLRCGNLLPTEQLYTETLLHSNRYRH